MNHKTVVAEILKDQQTEYVVSVNGQCMEPQISTGDHVRINPSDFYWPGDIILFHDSKHMLTTHRLLGLTFTFSGWRYMTKPDNSDQIDSLHKYDQIQGKVSYNLSKDMLIIANVTTRVLCVLRLLKHSSLCLFRRRALQTTRS